MRPPRWSRRAAIGLVVAAGAAGGAGAWRSARRAGRADAEGFLRSIVAFRAGYAPVEVEQLDRFVADYLRHDAWRITAIVAQMRAPELYGRPRLHGLAAGAHASAGLALLERHVVTALLMSSGFFEGGLPVAGRRLSYRGLRAPCANPFARRRPLVD